MTRTPQRPSGRRPWVIVAFTLLIAPFIAGTAQARDVPFDITYTGTLIPIPVSISGAPPPGGASILDGQAQGSFGASMVHIVTEWIPGTVTCDEGYSPYMLLHAAIVVTFSNNDQLFGAGFLGDVTGSMCMSSSTGHFVGQATGSFAGGTGRFEGASGTFVSPFSGYNITAGPPLGYGMGPIHGSLTGTLTLQ